MKKEGVRGSITNTQQFGGRWKMLTRNFAGIGHENEGVLHLNTGWRGSKRCGPPKYGLQKFIVKRPARWRAR